MTQFPQLAAKIYLQFSVKKNDLYLHYQDIILNRIVFFSLSLYAN